MKIWMSSDELEKAERVRALMNTVLFVLASVVIIFLMYGVWYDA